MSVDPIGNSAQQNRMEDNQGRNAEEKASAEKRQDRTLAQVLHETKIQGIEARLPRIPKQDSRSNVELVQALEHPHYGSREKATRELFNRPEAQDALLSAIPRAGKEQKERIRAVLVNRFEEETADLNIGKEFLISPFTEQQKAALGQSIQSAVNDGTVHEIEAAFDTLANKKIEVEAKRAKIEAFSERLAKVDLTPGEIYDRQMTELTGLRNNLSYPSEGGKLMLRYQQELAKGAQGSFTAIEKQVSIIEHAYQEKKSEASVEVAAQDHLGRMGALSLKLPPQSGSEELASEADLAMRLFAEDLSPAQKEFFGDRVEKTERAMNQALSEQDTSAVRQTLDQAYRYEKLLLLIKPPEGTKEVGLEPGSTMSRTLKEMRDSIDAGKTGDYDSLEKVLFAANVLQGRDATGSTIEDKLQHLLTTRIEQASQGGNQQQVEVFRRALNPTLSER